MRCKTLVPFCCQHSRTGYWKIKCPLNSYSRGRAWAYVWKPWLAANQSSCVVFCNLISNFCFLVLQEKLSARFQELSIKSSLSEFVVNSRALLDLQSVQVAAEAILKNEKPIPARGDHSSKNHLLQSLLNKVGRSSLLK